MQRVELPNHQAQGSFECPMFHECFAVDCRKANDKAMAQLRGYILGQHSRIVNDGLTASLRIYTQLAKKTSEWRAEGVR